MVRLRVTSPLIGIVFGLLFLVVGLGFLGFMASRVLKDARIANSWTQVDATVVATELHESKSKRKRSQSSSSRVRYTYRPLVTIRYQVDGADFETTCYDVFNMASSNRAREQAKLNDFPVGGTVKAWVNPADPGEAVVSVGDVNLMIYMGIPGIVILLGALVTAAGVRRMIVG